MIEIAADYARYRSFFSHRPGNKSILIVSSNFLAANVFLFTSKTALIESDGGLLVLSFIFTDNS